MISPFKTFQQNSQPENAFTCSSDSLSHYQSWINKIIKEENFLEEEQEEVLSRKVQIAICLTDEKKYKEALYWLEDTELLFNAVGLSKFDEELFELFFLKGFSFSKERRWQDALNAYKLALNIFNSNPVSPISGETLVKLYAALGKTYNRLNDHVLAIDCFNKLLAICYESSDCPRENLADIHISMGECYKFLGKKSSSLEHLDKATSHAKKLPYPDRDKKMISILEKKGRAYNYFDDYEKAIRSFNEELILCKQLFGNHSKRVAYSIDLIGNTHYYFKEYEKAISKFQKVVEIFEILGDQENGYVANVYSKIAACYTNLKRFKLAEIYMNRCFEVLEFDKKSDHPFENHKNTLDDLLITLYFKAKNHQKAYEAGWGKSQLHEASYWFDLCIELIEYINSTFTEPGSKQYLLERFYYIFEAAINCKYHLYQESDSLLYLEQAFGYAERSKALLLKEAMQMAGAVLASAIPESLQEEENRLKKAIIERENRRYELQQGGDGGPEVHELNSEIFNLKQAYHQVMDSIRRQHPKEHRLRYPAAPLAPREIQEGLLAPGQALLQYFLGDDHLFLFVIRQGDVSIVKKPKEKGLAEAVLGFRESIYGWSQSQEDSLAEQYAAYGYQLYQSLVQPVAHLLPERLIIVPDGILEYVPFEALLREAAGPAFRNFSSYPYLIRDFQISYAHSARLLQEMKTAAYAARRRWVLAFAPSFSDPPGQDTSLASRRRNLGRLTGNVKEVQAIKRLLRTRVYKGTDATRERFLADAPYYSIIHLATHAKANDEEGEYSYLAFAEVPDTLQNELLYAKDLYSLRLQADLVVISACESGVGELRRGEGVISIARGFSYAGAKSLATTLWRVSDRESAALMASFYQQLKDGRPKDEALRAAKLQFISQPGAMHAHPFFWAAFTLTGDMAPIAVSGQIFPAWVYALLIGLFVFLSLRFAKRKPS
ncbi:MAG: CHAT domain-containing protein [Phaeodactylibacter sp.]|nr:CHAT domain-containing protein [Phaeodactylibacter sp.]